MSATCAMSSWFVGVCECDRTTSSSEVFVVKKAAWCPLKVFPPLPYGIVSAVRPLKGKRNWPFQPPESTSTSNSRRALQCCQSVASEDGPCHRNRIVFSQPFVLSEPFSLLVSLLPSQSWICQLGCAGRQVGEGGCWCRDQPRHIDVHYLLILYSPLSYFVIWHFILEKWLFCWLLAQMYDF